MKRLMLVDFMGSAYTHYHANEANVELSFLQNIRDIIRTYRVDKTLILQEGGSNYRNSLLPSYKEARKKRRETQTEAQKAQYQKFVADTDRLADTLALLGCQKVKVYGAEADDLAGYFCAALPPEDYQILLLSEDSDWSQLLTRFNTVQGSYNAMVRAMPDLGKELWRNYGQFTEAKGLTPEQWFEKKMLSGDTSDSIPGIDGLGDTKAFDLIQRYENIAGVITAAQTDSIDVPRVQQKAKANLKACDDVLALGFKLMNLRWTTEQWYEILGDKAKTQLINARLQIDEPPVCKEENFQELCYERGWLDLLDRQWINAFYEK